MMKVILFGFDGLRPDCVTEETMPRLYTFLQDHVQCMNNRSVFPTETYVNHPSIFSGFLPERHGLVANAFFDPAVSRKDFFFGSWVDRIESAEELTRGALFQVPTLTEIVARNGGRFLSISSNSPGSTRLIAHKAAELGGINLSVNGFQHALPESLREVYQAEDQDRELEKPDIRGLMAINNVARDLFRADGLPDLSILWYGEPDHSFHKFGIGAPESLRVLKSADECFGEILDEFWTEDVQIIVSSDHGHITVKEHFDLTQALEDCGFRHSENLLNDEADFTLLWGYSGNIYTKTPTLIPEMMEALRQIPEIGMLFTRDRNGINGIAEGSFSNRLVGGDHARAGDIRFILRQDNQIDKYGYLGTCVCASPIPIGGGIHGGLHSSEINNVLGFGGTAFKECTEIHSTTGVIDITPTIYLLLGLKPKLQPQGRAIQEAFRHEPNEIIKGLRKNYHCSYGDFEQELILDDICGIPYLVSGGRLV